MPLDFLILKILHLGSVVLFVGSLFFITYVVDFLKRNSDKNEYKLFAPKISLRARKLMIINVSILTLSGSYILFVYYDLKNIETIMLIKLLLSVFIVCIFIAGKWIVRVTSHIHWFHHFFHHAVIALMATVVILSQMM